MIIAHHYCAHGGYAPFTAGTLPPGVVFVRSLGLFGRLSCSIFVPISRSMDQKTYRRLLLVLYVIWCVVPTITMHAWEFSNVDYFLVMYREVCAGDISHP